MRTSAPPRKEPKKPVVVQKPKRVRRRPPRNDKRDKPAKPREPVSPHGVDLRRLPGLPFTRVNTPSGQTSIVSIQQVLDRDSVIGVAVGIVSRLIDIGYASGYSTTDPLASSPYWLTQFLVNQMLLSARGLKLTVERVPFGILTLFDSLRPTNTNYKTGAVSFTWNPDTLAPINVPPIVNYGSLSLNLGVIASPTGGTVGYSSISPPIGYTDDNGLAAWNLLLSMLGTEIAGSPMLKLVDGIVDTLMKKDPSAFATAYPQIASGSVAAYTSQLFSPCKIRYPLYSIFVNYDEDTLVSSESHIFAGSPRWLGGRLLTLSDPRFARNKCRPVFQPVDFNDLFDLLSNIIGRAAELSAESNVATFLVPTCPLTAPQVALMLRGLISAFTNKSMPSDLALTDDNFRPLQFPYCSANVSAIAKMCQLPFYFVENLRSLAAVTAILPNAKGSDQQLCFMPVYGVSGEARNNYNYFYGTGNNANVYLYTQGTADFDIVNLLTTSNDYIAITGDSFSSAIEVWNAWVSQFTAVCPMGTLSTTANNPALYSLLYQRGYAYNPSFQPTTQEKFLSKTTKSQSRDLTPIFTYKSLIRQVKAVNPGRSNDVCEKYIASNYSMNESIYELMSNWVLPRVYSPNPISQQKYVGNFIMPYVVATNPDYGLNLNQTAFPLLEAKWRSAASVATHQATGEMSELLAVLWKATKEGHAGFLGSLLGDFATSVTGIPLFATIGSMVPF